MTDILNEIVARRRKDIEAKTVPLVELKARQNDRAGIRPFHWSLQQKMKRPGMAAIIAEIKRGSPAKGLFAPDLDPVQAAQEYDDLAACLSVLTEPHWFFGSLDDLIAARNACNLPVLQKDFVVTEYQVYEAAVHADAMLLIARCLERQQLANLHSLATQLGLDVLVEVFDEEDMDKIEPFHFPLIGINHRNLRTMSIDLERSKRLFSRFTADQTVVAASGIKSRADIEKLMRVGIRAFLVGESLSTHVDRVNYLNELVHGAPEYHRFIKICGITTPEMAIACLESGADAIGLVYYPPSPRHVDAVQMREILDAVESTISSPFYRAVLVVVDQLPEIIDPRITYIQTYSDIPSSEKKRHEIFHHGVHEISYRQIHVVKDDETFQRFMETPDEVEYVPLCALEMSQGIMPGGNGAAWDWSIAKPFCEKFPTLIAGGITPENVADVIRLTRPWGIDVSSGVESSPGVKDLDKVRRLIDAVRCSTTLIDEFR
jgi:indole-3-glycerol phosphate synthase/phosphoribosylanthranilate isomerase